MDQMSRSNEPFLKSHHNQEIWCHLQKNHVEPLYEKNRQFRVYFIIEDSYGLIPGGGRFQIRQEFRWHLGGAGHGTRVARSAPWRSSKRATLAAGAWGDVGTVQIQTDAGLMAGYAG